MNRKKEEDKHVVVMLSLHPRMRDAIDATVQEEEYTNRSEFMKECAKMRIKQLKNKKK